MKRLKAYAAILGTMGLRGLLRTLYLNFRTLPFRVAIRMPMYCSPYVRFASLSGRILFEGTPRRGTVRFGFIANDMFVPNTNVINLNIDGTVHFRGRGDIAGGVSINVGPRGRLSIGEEFFVNASTKIVCHESMTIGSWARIAWECQLFDTNFHYIQETATGRILRKAAPVKIGDNVWIGNRATVSRGAVIPSFTMVAQGSVCNKDYSGIPPDSILAGAPAKPVRSGLRRIASYAEEERISAELEANGNSDAGGRQEL